MFGSACELLYVYVYVLYARYVMLETERKLLTQSIADGIATMDQQRSELRIRLCDAAVSPTKRACYIV